MLAALLLRSPTWMASVIDADESLFILAGREVLAGNLPYTTMFDIKPPGLWLIYAAILGLGGVDSLPVRIAAGVCAGLTAILISAILRSAGAARAGAAGGGILYIAFSTGLGGTALHTEILLAPLATAGVLCCARSLHSTRAAALARAIAITGLLFGLGALIKQTAALPAAAIIVVTCGLRWLRGEVPPHILLAVLFLGAGAVLLPTAAAAGVFWLADAFAAYWHANFGFMPLYAADSRPLGLLVRQMLRIVEYLWPLMALGALRLLTFRPPSVRRDATAVLLWAWLLAETGAALAARQYYGHHFLVLLPPLCVIGAQWLDMAVREAVIASRRAAAALGCAVFVAGIPAVTYLYLQPWSRAYRPDALRLAAEAAAARLAPGDHVYVANAEPALYYLMRSPLPTMVVFPAHLIGNQSYLSPLDPERELARILATRPRMVVIDQTTWSGVRPEPAARILSLLGSEYQEFQSVEYQGQTLKFFIRR